MKTITTPILLLLAASLVLACGMPGCMSYQIDTVDFELTRSTTAAKGLKPKTYIDTNIKIPGPFGGNVKSSKPYSIAIEHTDLSFTITAVEITKAEVTYLDGTTDPGCSTLKLPMRFDSRHHVAINSGGPPPKYTFETPMRLIVGKIPDVISRDEPVTLLLEGRFIKDNGQTILFTIRESYKPVREKSSFSWVEAMESI